MKTIDLSQRAKFRMSGADRLRYLNGQVSNDVAKLGEGEVMSACVTTAKGRLQAHVWIAIEAGGEAFLIDTDAVEMYQTAIQKVKSEGGKTVVEGEVLSGAGYESGCYVKPAIYEVENSYEIVCNETFAPILYLIKYSSIDEAIEMQNAVPQGLSSAIMTTNIRESELFLSQSNPVPCGTWCRP